MLPASEATVPLLDDGFLRGDAVFDAVLVRRGRTHALQSHLARLRRSAEALGIRLPALRRVVDDLLAAWGEHDGALRLIVTRGGAVRALLHQPAWPPSVALHPLAIPWRTALSGVKTVSYAANAWATRQAQLALADEALIVPDGVVHEAPTAAFVWVRDGRLHAPDWSQLPILASVTLVELRKVIDVHLGVFRLDEVLQAEEAFLLSATRPVLPVHAIGDAELPAPGPATEAARTAFLAHVDATLDPRP